jgi:catechol 2,3-dioxygenase-like lactoylglutathione lyase family enzyme
VAVAPRLQVAIDCDDPERLAAFWVEVLSYRQAPPPGGFATWAEFSSTVSATPGERWSRISDPAGTGPDLLFHRVPEPKVAKNRVHLDVHISAGAAAGEARRVVDAETRRLVALGAAHLRTEEDATDYFAVLQDPEGNEFCLD